jgi:dihydrofolate reductase
MGDSTNDTQGVKMRRVIVNNIVSLDGYYEGPDGSPMSLNMDAAFDAYNRERIEHADVVLLGRTSFQGFSSYWPQIADAPDDPDNRAVSEDNRALSRVYNQLQKVVVSDSYTPEADNPWFDTATRVRRDEVAAWIEGEREAGDGDILVFGSRTMWNGLLALGLVDDLHLTVSPAVLGGGTPAFAGPTATPVGLRVVEARPFADSDNVLLRYAPER